MPSACSSSLTPTSASRAHMTAMRSLSWWRIWATLRSDTGPSANTDTAASDSVASDSGRMSKVWPPFSGPRRATVTVDGVMVTSQPICSSRPASPKSGCSVSLPMLAMCTRPPVTAASAMK